MNSMMALAGGLYLRRSVARHRVCGTQYFAGYIAEMALSVDNVFVFLVILSALKVPREHQQKALLIGIVIALIVRTGFILPGAVLIERFAWVCYVFGLVLLVTATCSR